MGFLQGMAGQVLANALGGSQGGGLASLVLGMINNQPGGLGGLVQAFQNKGMGDIVSSWVGTGANQPISPDQMQDALGSDTIEQMAQQTGVSAGDLTSQLSNLLPGMVDHLTPEGRIPEGLQNINLDMLKGFLK